LLRNRDERLETEVIMTPLERKLTQMLTPVLKDMGFHLVLLEFKSGTLQIFAEDPETGNLSLDDCTAISKAISPALEVEDPISGAYMLEVSSPGIDRPLMRMEDFERYQGFDARVELDMPLENGQKRFRGPITGIDKEFVTLTVDGVEQKLELVNIKRARLVLTDDLIKATKKENVTA